MTTTQMTIDEQVALLMQGTEYGDEDLKRTMADELRRRLIDAEQGNRPLRVYCGFDPRTSDLHLGHTVPMRKLRQFQELGHEVTFVVGSFTSLIGDPSDKDKLRPQLTPQQVEYNAQTYAEQAYKVLDRKKTLIRFNSEWLSELSFAEIIKLASNFTLQQFLTRENFRLRWERGDAIFLHETFYALMQSYDAFHLRTDVQVGGTDQLFNIVTAARKIMTFLGEKPNVAGHRWRSQDEQVVGEPHPAAFHARRHVWQGDEHPRQGYGTILPPGDALDTTGDRRIGEGHVRRSPAPAGRQNETGA
jgi:tyrosyl-tRNA synthetase